MMLTGKQSTIEFPDNDAILTASCRGLTASAGSVSYIFPTTIQSPDGGYPAGANVTAVLNGVAFSCAGHPLSAPCASYPMNPNEPERPRQFSCDWVGPSSRTTLGPIAAERYFDSVEGVVVGKGTRLVCPLPSLKRFQAIGGEAGGLWLEVHFLGEELPALSPVNVTLNILSPSPPPPLPPPPSPSPPHDPPPSSPSPRNPPGISVPWTQVSNPHELDGGGWVPWWWFSPNQKSWPDGCAPELPRPALPPCGSRSPPLFSRGISRPPPPAPIGTRTSSRTRPTRARSRPPSASQSCRAPSSRIPRNSSRLTRRGPFSSGPFLRRTMWRAPLGTR